MATEGFAKTTQRPPILSEWEAYHNHSASVLLQIMYRVRGSCHISIVIMSHVGPPANIWGATVNLAKKSALRQSSMLFSE
eukprot:CAMPEP_0173092920 /NCGR_PEP_ID=MMETSP1102-20130122/29507_1 /TAXON_ID=49646 /ORGANISM="Geminigera sp., Strain Caron Lab Isolate" /LENGTH=79 /DNA_ID=CAMNT_0013980487 /DNA_START=168 /DNA_END=407 /DNA_ORIENTATION=-